MSIQFKEEDGGKSLVVQVSGKLTKADYEHFVPEFDRLIEHFADTERLAMVGETQWQHGMATFCKPFTNATVRYFDHAEAKAVRQWLGESLLAATIGAH